MNPLTILIVEDDLNIAEAAREALERAGHRITAIAQTSDQALLSIRKQPPGVAIVDIRLDDSPANGIAVAQELLRHRAIAVLFLTGVSDTALLDKAKALGPAAFLFKPFLTHQLPIQVEVAHAQHQATQAGVFPSVREAVFLPINKSHERVSYNEVLFLRADGAYTRLFRLNRPAPDLLTMNLGYVEQFFDNPDFFKLSRSVLINLRYVERLERNQIVLRGYPELLTIPETKRAALTRCLRVVPTP